MDVSAPFENAASDRSVDIRFGFRRSSDEYASSSIFLRRERSSSDVGEGERD